MQAHQLLHGQLFTLPHEGHGGGCTEMYTLEFTVWENGELVDCIIRRVASWWSPDQLHPNSPGQWVLNSGGETTCSPSASVQLISNPFTPSSKNPSHRLA